ncbi:mitochodrial transcription termination factor [Artemisia annua]|uniref:Mitochodrial transcription termination factor n=1 Tax=Artemisia annua TaxID=35608 RepID=A0A2U1MAT7_ARTAN|nr:mitochodrial transcription termination factor [Artemisia annua]
MSHGNFLISSHPLKYFSIESSNPNEDNIMVNFLINSVGFTKEAAITTLSKVPSLKSTKNPESVINIFKQFNLDNTHIKDIIFYAPQILTCNPNKTLEPKIKVFLENGFSRSDLVQLTKANPSLLRYGLHTRIIPVLNLIRTFVTNDEQAVEVMRKAAWLFCDFCASFDNVSANLLQLRIRGLSNDQIVRLITHHRWVVTLDPLTFERKLVWIVEELGIPEHSKMFVHGLCTITRLKESTIENKLKILSDYGWSEEEIAKFVRTNPVNLSYSEAKIRRWLDFFMNELGYTSTYLSSSTCLLSCSLEKRVKPRYKVFSILKEKKLVGSKPSLSGLVNFSEVKFLKFLNQFENELPGLAKTYTSSITETQRFA